MAYGMFGLGVQSGRWLARLLMLPLPPAKWSSSDRAAGSIELFDALPPADLSSTDSITLPRAGIATPELVEFEFQYQRLEHSRIP